MGCVSGSAMRTPTAIEQQQKLAAVKIGLIPVKMPSQ
jgi:hypothetical protein